jgi:predicted amidohydrolase
MLIALCQFPIENTLSKNLFENKVEAYFQRSAEKKVDLLIFPELFVLDRIDRIDHKNDASALFSLAQEMPDFLGFLKSLSKKYGMAVLAGSFPWITGKTVRNRSYFLGPLGEEYFQEKIYLTPDEKLWGWQGADELQPFVYQNVKIQILICYDIQFAALSQQLAAENVEVFLCPSLTDEFGRERVAIGCQARSLENFAYTLVTGATRGKSGLYRSRAALYSPRNEFFSLPKEAGSEDLFFSQLDIDQLRSAKKTTGIYSGRDSLERARAVLIRNR